MSKLHLIGIDPGIRDTGLVRVGLDFGNRVIEVEAVAFSNVVTESEKGVYRTDQKYLDDISAVVQNCEGLKLVGIEGYRPRGKDKHQDAMMQVLIHDTHTTLTPSKVVDNTGIKLVVKEDLLKMFHVSRFPCTNHADLKSAARVALKTGIYSVNELMSDYVLDHLEGRQWSLAST